MKRKNSDVWRKIYCTICTLHIFYNAYIYINIMCIYVYIYIYIYTKRYYTRHRHCNIELEFDCLHFCFHALYSATNLRVWKRVLCFHMTSFKYGAKRVRDDGPICRCHQSHFMSDGTFIIKIAQLLLLFVDTRCSDFSLLYLLASGNLQL